MKKLLLCLLLMSSPSWAEFTGQLDQETALKKIKAKEVIVLDVRTKDEFSQGRVPGAINIPHSELEARIAEISQYKDQSVLVYCRSGRRAGIAEPILSNHGFKQLYHLKGDMLEWSKNQLPIEK